MRVAIIGGTGPFGKALARRLQSAGYDVVVGSRDADRAAKIAGELGVDGASNNDAARSAELVILATEAQAAIETARGLRRAIGTTPVLSVASDIRFSAAGVSTADEMHSVAERIRDELGAPVVAGFHSLAASNLGSAHPLHEDAFVCGDDEGAKALVLELAGRVTSGRALDAGPLSNARVLEGLTAVLVNVNRRYKAHAGIRVTGLP